MSEVNLRIYTTRDFVSKAKLELYINSILAKELITKFQLAEII